MDADSTTPGRVPAGRRRRSWLLELDRRRHERAATGKGRGRRTTDAPEGTGDGATRNEGRVAGGVVALAAIELETWFG